MAHPNPNWNRFDPWYDPHKQEREARWEALAEAAYDSVANPNRDVEFYNSLTAEQLENIQRQEGESEEQHRRTLQKTKAKREAAKLTEDLYGLMRELPGTNLFEQTQLLVALSLILLKDEGRPPALIKAIRHQDKEALGKLLREHATTYGFFSGESTDAEAVAPLDGFLSNPLYFLNENAEQKLFDRLAHSADLITLYFSEHRALDLFNALSRFIEQHHREFDYYWLSFDIKVVMYHYLNYFGYSPDWLVRDAAAGCGLLTMNLFYPGHDPRWQYESQSKNLANLGIQLYALMTDSKPPQGLFTINNPLMQKSALPSTQADVVISLPPTAYRMNDDERNPNHDFLAVHLNKPLPQYDTDPLWIQQALDSVKSDGLVFLVVQDGFLKRGGYDAQVRQYLVEKGLLVAVISLHADHAKQSKYSQLSLLVINKDTQHNPNKAVLFWYMRTLPKVHLYEEPNDDEIGFNYDDLVPLCNLSLYPFMSEDEKNQACATLGIGRMDFIKTAPELKRQNYNLSYEFYLGDNREHDYPGLQQADAEFKQAKADYLKALAGFEGLLVSE